MEALPAHWLQYGLSCFTKGWGNKALHRGNKGSQLTEPGTTTIIIQSETRPKVYLSLSKRFQVVVVSLVPLISCLSFITLLLGSFPLFQGWIFLTSTFIHWIFVSQIGKLLTYVFPRSNYLPSVMKVCLCFLFSELNMLSFLPITSEGMGFFFKAREYICDTHLNSVQCLQILLKCRH